jgi:hypothetical protein
MTTPKSNIKNQVENVGLFEGFSCSERNSKVDLQQITVDCNTALAKKELAIGLALKFNLHGNKIRPGDYIEVGGTRHECKVLLDSIHAYQEKNGVDVKGSKSSTVGIAKISDKRVASVTRICRAYAKSTSFLIEKGAIPLPDDLITLSKDTGLPPNLSFLAAPYGMTDEEIKTHGNAFSKFCKNFNDAVEKAYKSGGLTSSTGNKRNHEEEFVNYVKWRGITM